MTVNYYDYIAFPSRVQREQYKQNYFDSQKLRLKLDDNFELIDNYIYSHTQQCGEQSFQNKVVYFNNTVVYFDLAILRFAHYYTMLMQCNESDIKVYQVLFRQAYRNISCEVYIYEEKVKDLLRFIFSMNKEDTQYDGAFLIALKESCYKTSYGKEFYHFATNNYHKDKNVQAVIKVRNDEVHNSTKLLKDYGDYNIEYNHKINETVQACLNKLCDLRKALEKFLTMLCQAN